MFYAAVLLSSLIFLLSPADAFAASLVTTTPENLSLKSSPGQTLTEVVYIKNETGQPLEASFSWKKTAAVTHSIDFAQINPKSLNLEPFSGTQVELILKIPQLIKPGDYFGKLIVAAADKEVASTAVQLRVLGTTKQSINIKSFEYKDEQMSIKITNSGDLKEQVSLTTETSSLFGILKEKETRKIEILPEETKEVTSKQSLLPSYYSTTVTIEYGDKTQTDVFSFWSLNLPFLAATGVLFLLIVILSLKVFKRT